MIKKLHFKSLLLLAVMLLGAGSAWAETSTLTFTSACEGSGTADDGVKWAVTSDGEESNFDKIKGVHYGTSSAEVQYIKLSTSDISGTITKIVVNASTAKSVSATVGVTVGGDTFGGDPKSLTNSANDYTFSGSASGEIIVTVTKPEKATKALYVMSIAVTYDSGGSSTTKTKTTVTITNKTETATVGETIDAPQAVVNAGTETVTSPAIIWSSSDTSVATIDESNGDITLIAAGTTTITATYEGNDTYEASSASFDLTVSAAAVPPTTYTTIAELQSNATDTKTPIKFTFNNILVTAVKDKNAYITDGENGALIYTEGHGFKAGDIINGTIETNLVLYKGQTEITDVKASDENLIITSGSVTPTEVTLEEITAANQSLLVTLKGLTYNSSKSTFSHGTSSIKYYKYFTDDPVLEDGKVYDVTGVVIVFNTTIEISPLSVDDVVEVVSATQEAPESAWKSDGEAISSICVLPGENLSASFETTSTGDKSFVSSNTAVATVDDNGAITLTGTAGVAVITAATKANDEFFASSATLTVVVAEKEAEDGVFDFALFNDYGSGIVPDGSDYNTEESTWTAGNVTMKVSGKYRWFLSTKNVSDFRLYSAAEGNPQTSFTITAPAGHVITSINGVVNTLTADKGEINSTTWTGMENEVTFTYTSNATITKLIVNYSTPEVTVTIGDDYKTFCSNVPLDFSESGIKVYTAKQSKGTVVLTEVTSGKIPAVRGVILKGEAGDHTAKVIESAEKLENNELYGVVTDTNVEYQPSKTMFNYILQGGVFKKATGATLKAGKAYLHTAYDITGGGESRLTIIINNETTGISSATEQAGDGAVYSLSGQRVVNPTKGLYIVNGKKYVIK